MGGFKDYDVIDISCRPTTLISDSIKKEFNDMPEERKSKVIELLQAKVRMLEQTLIAEHNRYEYEQAEEDRKFFLDYRADGVRKCSDAQREEADRAIERIDQVLPYRGFEQSITKNLFDRNVMFDQLFGLKADENGELVTVEEKDTVMSAKECSIFDETPFEDIDMTPTKVTLAEDINKELDQLSMPVERMGNVCIVVNKRTHNIVYSNETEDTVTITFERK